MQTEAKAIEKTEAPAAEPLNPWIVERSEMAARGCQVWTWEDHHALLDHLRRVDELAMQVARYREEQRQKADVA